MNKQKDNKEEQRVKIQWQIEQTGLGISFREDFPGRENCSCMESKDRNSSCIEEIHDS